MAACDTTNCGPGCASLRDASKAASAGWLKANQLPHLSAHLAVLGGKAKF